MKTACIYHNKDLDGWMSAAIVRYRYLENTECRVYYNENETTALLVPELSNDEDCITFIGYDHGEPIPDLTWYNTVIMVDICFPKEEMCKILASKHFIWIDHHISAIKDWEWVKEETGNDTLGIRNTKFSACELTWQYFFPDTPMPEIVRLLGRYDCYQHIGTDEEEKIFIFQFGALTIIQNISDAYGELVDNIHCEHTESGIYQKGVFVYKYLCDDAKKAYKEGFPIEFITEDTTRYKFLAINKPHFSPKDFGIDCSKDGYHGTAAFYLRGNGMWSISLRDSMMQSVDCSIIAKQYGGGGHTGAARFEVNDINEFFYDHKI